MSRCFRTSPQPSVHYTSSESMRYTIDKLRITTSLTSFSRPQDYPDFSASIAEKQEGNQQVCMKAPTNTPLGKRHGPNLKLPSGWCVGVGASLPPSPCLSTSTRHKLAGWQHHSDCPCVYPPIPKLCDGVCAWIAVFMRMSLGYVIGCVFVLFVNYGNVGSRSQRWCW